MRLYSPLGFFFFRLRRHKKFFTCCCCDWNGEKGFEMRWLDDSTPSFLSRPPLPPPPTPSTPPHVPLWSSEKFCYSYQILFSLFGPITRWERKRGGRGKIFFSPLNLIILLGLWNGWCCCRGVYAPKKKKVTVGCDMLAAELKVTQEFGKLVVVVSAA